MEKTDTLRFSWTKVVSRVTVVALGIIGSLLTVQLQYVTKRLDMIHDHEKRLVVIESNRYTSHNAIRDRLELKDWIQTHFPPASLKEDIREIKEDIRDIERRLNVGGQGASFETEDSEAVFSFPLDSEGGWRVKRPTNLPESKES